MIKISFPDGSVREYENGITGMQIAESISPALARNCVACGVNGETTELNRPINDVLRTKRVSMPSGTLPLTFLQKPSRSCSLAYSSDSVLLSRTVSSTMFFFLMGR